VAIRPPKYNSQGFTLIEMLVAIAMAGIMMAWAVAIQESAQLDSIKSDFW
jgi:prepilin-type N-terminal cleavage/methylation domain-containing protein